jgi:glycerol kinase
MQFQADLLGIPVERPAVLETTAQGAAYLCWSGDRLLGKRKRSRRLVSFSVRE